MTARAPNSSREDPFSRTAKLIAAVSILTPALLLPYRFRVQYTALVSLMFHLPFKLFGKVARFLLDQLSIEPLVTQPPTPAAQFAISQNLLPSKEQTAIAIAFSGGTDSTCVAALLAPHVQHIHLLTFYELATRHSPRPDANAKRLRQKFPQTTFISKMFSTDAIVRFLSYSEYLKTFRNFGYLTLATCGFSSLSWHIRMILYCREHKITYVADGLTKELMHFPGHMDQGVEQFRLLYESFGIRYVNPVRDWPVPDDQQFIDRVIVNGHESDYVLGDENKIRQTTGAYLYQLGVMPSPNMKGSKADFLMQHDCYPFVLYNILTFWYYLGSIPYEAFCLRISLLQSDRIAKAKELLENHFEAPDKSRLRFMITQEST